MMTEPADPALDRVVLDSLRQLSEPGQPDVLQEVLNLFLNDAPSRLEAIEAAVTAGDARGLQRAAHTMKGSSGTIGASALQKVCLSLEQMGKAAELSDAAAGLEQLRSEYRRVQDAIHQLL
jgi:HPt (histidine-containing phosphotransfer) domain-containing protein